jgi:hypothetical protein
VVLPKCCSISSLFGQLACDTDAGILLPTLISLSVDEILNAPYDEEIRFHSQQPNCVSPMWLSGLHEKCFSCSTCLLYFFLSFISFIFLFAEPALSTSLKFSCYLTIYPLDIPKDLAR